MTMRDFIKNNRADLCAAIRGATSFVPRTASCDCHKCGTDHHHYSDEKISNDEIRQWVLNDEGLYGWARREGVRV